MGHAGNDINGKDVSRAGSQPHSIEASGCCSRTRRSLNKRRSALTAFAKGLASVGSVGIGSCAALGLGVIDREGSSPAGIHGLSPSHHAHGRRSIGYRTGAARISNCLGCYPERKTVYEHSTAQCLRTSVRIQRALRQPTCEQDHKVACRASHAFALLPHLCIECEGRCASTGPYPSPVYIALAVRFEPRPAWIATFLFACARNKIRDRNTTHVFGGANIAGQGQGRAGVSEFLVALRRTLPSSECIKCSCMNRPIGLVPIRFASQTARYRLAHQQQLNSAAKVSSASGYPCDAGCHEAVVGQNLLPRTKATHTTISSSLFLHSTAQFDDHDPSRAVTTLHHLPPDLLAMVKFHTHSYTHSHPFPTVMLAYYLRYPNPYSTHVLSTDTIARHYDPSTQRLYTARLHLKRSKIPAAVLSLLPAGILGSKGRSTDGTSQSWILERSVVDVNSGVMITESRNLDLTGVLAVRESQLYTKPGADLQAFFKDYNPRAGWRIGVDFERPRWRLPSLQSVSQADADAEEQTNVTTKVELVSRLGEVWQRRKSASAAAMASTQDDDAPPKMGFFRSLGTASVQRSIEAIGLRRTERAVSKSVEGMNVVLARMRRGGLVAVLEGMRRDREAIDAM
ncbi:hypothetical protein MRB53_036982 [Persea americana]|nr:hypothetical protein MRB53_036982 [Persea americana]